MNLPPTVSTVRIAEPGSKGFRLWVPVFLLWPLLVVLGALVMVAALAADAVLWLSGRRYHRYSRLVAGLFAAFGEARGLAVAVDGPGKSVYIELK